MIHGRLDVAGLGALWNCESSAEGSKGALFVSDLGIIGVLLLFFRKSADGKLVAF